MRISSINYQTKPHFVGENKKNNTLKNATGAAAIAILTAIPTEKAEAQIYYPPPIYPPITYSYPTPSYNTPTTVPNCFIYGDTKYSDTDKTIRDAFDEIDANGNENGVISAREVVRTERNNWNRNSLTPYTTAQMRKTEQQFNALSRIYNEDDSDPATMNYREYKAVMKDYTETKANQQMNDIINILTIPYLYPPIYHTPHHHHRHPHHRHHHHRH